MLQEAIFALLITFYVSNLHYIVLEVYRDYCPEIKLQYFHYVTMTCCI